MRGVRRERVPGPRCRRTGRGRVQHAEWVGAPSVEAAVDVRRELERLLARWELRTEVAEDALLVVTELLENVVVHARTPFRLSVRLQGPLLHVAVADGRVGVPARAPNFVVGRISGLRLVTAVALRWGYREHEAGKTVWAELVV